MEQRGKLKRRWGDGNIKGIKRRVCYEIQPLQNYISLAHTMQYLNGTVENFKQEASDDKSDLSYNPEQNVVRLKESPVP
jgi:hypothetical protein